VETRNSRDKTKDKGAATVKSMSRSRSRKRGRTKDYGRRGGKYTTDPTLCKRKKWKQRSNFLVRWKKYTSYSEMVQVKRNGIEESY
jgi:hypothetical protein